MSKIIKITFNSVPNFGDFIKLEAHRNLGNYIFEETFVTTRIGSGECTIQTTIAFQASYYMFCFLSDFGANSDIANFDISCLDNEITIKCKSGKLYDYWNTVDISGTFATYVLTDETISNEVETTLPDSINQSINNKSQYRFQLWFKNDNVVEEISEPWEFDGYSHSVEKKKDGWALDVYLFAENTSLLFTNSAYEKSTMFEDIDGTIMFNIGHGLKRIIDTYNTYGADGEIELRIYFNDELLTKCDFDMEDINSDLKSSFKCGFIENNKRSKFKINENDVLINIYSDRNIDNEPIDILIPEKILLLSTPQEADSKWIKSDIPYVGFGAPGDVTNKIPAGAYDYFNFCKNPIVYGIDDTLEPSPFEYDNSYTDTYDGTMKMIDCKTTKKRSKIKVTSNVSWVHKQNGRVGWPNKSSLGLYLRVSYGTGITDSIVYTLYYNECIGTTIQEFTVPAIIEFDIPGIINDGQFITLFWHHDWDDGTIALSLDWNTIENYSHVKFNDCVVEMSTIETSINSVIQGSRWINLLKQTAKIINGFTIDAPRIDIGGEYYDTICTNGGGIRNIDGIPFNVKAKDVFEMGMMVALDYQITDEDIKIGNYNDFHSDKLIRKFDVMPDEKFYWNTNKDYRIKTFNYKFDIYEQNRLEEKTLDAVHTEEQITTPNKKTIASKDIKIKQILDGYNINSLRKLGIDPQTEDTSLEDDTAIVMLKVRALNSSHQEIYVGLLYISTIPGGIKIYSSNFRWDKTGLGLTSTFEILSGINSGVYSITKIEKTLLTLTTISSIINHSESKIITIRYSLENVTMISETTESFEDIQGVLSPETFLNLYYSKLRNIQNWLPYLATCSMRYINDFLKVTFLKSNQSLSTRLIGETTNLVEHDNISLSSISNKKKVTDRTFKISVYPENPLDMVDIFKELNVRNSDGTIGGYFEFNDNSNESIKGYIDKLEYIPNLNKIEAICSEKYDPDKFFININNIDRDLYLQYSVNGIYITILKADGSNFVVGKRFTYIIINGIEYTDLATFINDLQIYFS